MTSHDVYRRGTEDELAACLREAYDAFREPALLALHEQLCRGEADEPATAPWYKRDPDRLNREARVLARALKPEPGSILLGTNGGQLFAVGLLALNGKKRQKVALRFPDDYPDSPPTVYLHRTTHLIPLPLALDSWTRHDDAGVALEQARKALQAGLLTPQGER